jgi:hypothetical protein
MCIPTWKKRVGARAGPRHRELCCPMSVTSGVSRVYTICRVLYLSIYISYVECSICLSIYCLFLFIALSSYVFCVSKYVFMYVSMYLCIYVSIYLCIYVSMYLCIYLSIYLSICLSIYVSMYLCIYVSMYNIESAMYSMTVVHAGG